MNANNYKRVGLFENRFWLQILGDHARFIFGALSAENKQLLQRANYFIKSFDQLLEETTTALSENELAFLAKRALNYSMEFRDFKLSLLEKMLIDNLAINLTPSVINHMINELEEYLLLLKYLIKAEVPPILNPLRYHLLWLLATKGHAAMISRRLDDTEKDLLLESDEHQGVFIDLYLKALELNYYLRINRTDIPIVNGFNQQVGAELQSYIEFLENLLSLVENKLTASKLNPLLIDHMIREECYYLVKLASSAGLQIPRCDPTRPRIKP